MHHAHVTVFCCHVSKSQILLNSGNEFHYAAVFFNVLILEIDSD